MKYKIFILIILTFLSACQSYTGVIIGKIHKDAHTEIIPPGYRTSCGITIEGKYECGFKFFVTTKYIHHPEEFIVSVEVNDSCVINKSVDSITYNELEIGNLIEVEGNC